jgi:hypothetical protein
MYAFDILCDYFYIYGSVDCEKKLITTTTTTTESIVPIRGIGCL